MAREIAEADWKKLRALSRVALDRYCAGVLASLSVLAGEAEEGAHAKYLKVYKLIQRRDKELAEIFNDLRRSTAYFQLARMAHANLLTDEELATFGQETRDVLRLFTEGPSS